MATPNNEQIKAIEHFGGVLLKAGAGSGKTFVLKEHMIFLTRNWIKEFGQSIDEDFSGFIRGKFKKVVLMTFTNKAAGELKIRLKKEFEDVLGSESEEKDYWNIIVQNLNYLTVSTIHSFCFKLIRQGYFRNTSAEQTLISESDFKQRIEDIFDEWLADEKHREEEIYEIIIKEKKSILASVTAIFSDPSLRASWQSIDIAGLGSEDETQVINEIFSLNGLASVFQEFLDPATLSDFKGKKWCDFLTEFANDMGQLELNLENVLKLHNYFMARDYKIPAKPSAKTIPDHVKAHYAKVRDLKDYLKKNAEHFEAYAQTYAIRVVPWFSMVKDLFDTVEHEYSKLDGVTYSDLEYLVYKGLDCETARREISEQFNYFIIDEFQDTSYLQFSIIDRIINSDFSRLFCVGDLKQAIYGFRGGELGVFLKCEQLMPRNLILSNNYRSDIDVVEFNNKFFDYLFSEWQTHNEVQAKQNTMDFQLVPESKTDHGVIRSLKCDLSFITGDEKLSNFEIDYLEALALLEQIKRNQEKNESSAVLYKKLKPSLILIDLLIKNDLSFTAQTKIPFLEDPIVGIFYLLTSFAFDKNEEKEKYLVYSLKAYLSLLGISTVKEISFDDVLKYQKEIRTIGQYHAFCNFLLFCGIKNSNFKNNLEQISQYISIACGDQEKLFKLLVKQRKVSYSLDFQYGNSPEKIIMMSAHASKGLQFKNVLLGGVYTNETTSTMISSIGKIPMSFKWTISMHGKKKYKTPWFLLEESMTKKKDFSESKRLFYVANTRAESSLSYIQFDFGDNKRSKAQKGCWANGIESWLLERADFARIENLSENIELKFNDDDLKKLAFKPPFFHTDNLGIESCDLPQKHYFLPEVSITKLATLCICPKKFYLQNICKLSDDDMSLIESPELIVPISDGLDELNSSSFKMSASERGSMIHENLSSIIQNNFQGEFSSDDKKTERAILWTVDNLKMFLENYDFLSENPIKFELMNYMVSGIPDLVLYPSVENKEAQVWDFKTGRATEEKLAPYTFQLMCYAYAQFILDKVDKSNKIKIVLCFVDDQKLIEQSVSREDVEKYISQVFEKLNHPEEENLSECLYCPYKIICQK
jgi:ATP-dependent helicase/nuclease subunit A